MNWLDVVIGAVVVFSFFGALWNGLSREIIRLIALAAGIIAGMWRYEDLSVHFAPYIQSEKLAGFAAFLAIVMGSLLAGAVLAWILAKILHWAGLRWFDRLLGGAFGLVRGLAVSTALVLAVVAFHPTEKTTETVADSRLAPIVLHGARAAAAVAPAKLQLDFAQGFERVRGAWTESVSQSAVKH